MDAKTFDDLVARMFRGTSRRDTVKGVLAGAVAAVGVPVLGEAKTKKGKGKGKHRKGTGKADKGQRQAAAKQQPSEVQAARRRKPCSSCITRKRGKCRVSLPDGTTCTDTAGQNGICQSGICVPGPTPGTTTTPEPGTTTTTPEPGTTTTTTTVAPETCDDGILNGAETDVDCGGGTCPRCANGQSCLSRDDCRGALCVDGICQPCGSCGTASDGVSCICAVGPRGGCHPSQGAFVEMVEPDVECSPGLIRRLDPSDPTGPALCFNPCS